MRIYLIGMPGSGKSTLGKGLAKTLSYTFVDLDELIVKMEGKPISEIFKQSGEAYFRQVERSALQHTVSLDNIVVATGGGTPCFFDNTAIMNQAGISIFLEVPLDHLVNRVAPNPERQSVRPLFAGKSRAEVRLALDSMWQQRAPFYRKATITVSPAEAKPGKVAERIHQWFC
jgi:shikimate kinase